MHVHIQSAPPHSRKKSVGLKLITDDVREPFDCSKRKYAVIGLKGGNHKVDYECEL